MSRDIPLESAIVAQIMRELKTLGGWWIKTHGGAFQAAGIPDILGCYRGRFCGLEVKRPHVGRPTILQLYTLAAIRQAGGIAEIVTSVEDVRRALEVDAHSGGYGDSDGRERREGSRARDRGKAGRGAGTGGKDNRRA